MTGSGVPLWELVTLIRAKNAGPWMITIDIMFSDTDAYERVKSSGVIDAALISRLYRVDEEKVLASAHDAAMALKVSIPRRISCGGLGDTDVFGGQFHGPLVELEIP